eukprot:CAMPEP_0113818268 /NCGR_PEP_ID=MMETSP0328-20130328/155_1 /TAXON_ID=39455 /ORGANISM="Alexandrium minutum" /LENGTH=466 /DNA_ID=CAMNT_0000786203 /DNA_START=115 /DNA_END=1515 /DNA_ORIENTATION=+ /assembly_acc=CAM_ASM_000350
MVDPFGLMNRALDRGMRSRPGSGRKQQIRNPDDPKDLEYLRSMHPDFDEVMGSGQIDYKTPLPERRELRELVPDPAGRRPRADVSGARELRRRGVLGAGAGALPFCVARCHVEALERRKRQVHEHASRPLGGRVPLRRLREQEADRVLRLRGGAEPADLAVAAGRGRPVVAGPPEIVVHAAFAPDDRSVASTDLEGTLMVSDLGTGACTLKQTLHLGAAHATSFCRSEPSLLCTAGADGALQLLDLRVHTLPPARRPPSMLANCVELNAALGIRAAHDGHPVHAVEFADRDTIFSGGADHKLKRWDVRMSDHWNTTCLREYLGHTGSIRCLALSPNQRFIVTGCEDGSCRVWPKDVLGDVRQSLGELRAQAEALDAKLQETSVPAEAQGLRRRRSELRQAMAPLRASEEQLAREGHGSAIRTLNGHVALVSGCAWQEDVATNTATVISSSWDQSVQMFKLDLSTLA